MIRMGLTIRMSFTNEQARAEGVSIGWGTIAMGQLDIMDNGKLSTEAYWLLAPKILHKVANGELEHVCYTSRQLHDWLWEQVGPLCEVTDHTVRQAAVAAALNETIDRLCSTAGEFGLVCLDPPVAPHGPAPVDNIFTLRSRNWEAEWLTRRSKILGSAADPLPLRFAGDGVETEGVEGQCDSMADGDNDTHAARRGGSSASLALGPGGSMTGRQMSFGTR